MEVYKASERHRQLAKKLQQLESVRRDYESHCTNPRDGVLPPCFGEYSTFHPPSRVFRESKFMLQTLKNRVESPEGTATQAENSIQPGQKSVPSSLQEGTLEYYSNFFQSEDEQLEGPSSPLREQLKSSIDLSAKKLKEEHKARVQKEVQNVGNAKAVVPKSGNLQNNLKNNEPTKKSIPAKPVKIRFVSKDKGTEKSTPVPPKEKVSELPKLKVALDDPTGGKAEGKTKERPQEPKKIQEKTQEKSQLRAHEKVQEKSQLKAQEKIQLKIQEKAQEKVQINVQEREKGQLKVEEKAQEKSQVKAQGQEKSQGKVQDKGKVHQEKEKIQGQVQENPQERIQSRLQGKRPEKANLKAQGKPPDKIQRKAQEKGRKVPPNPAEPHTLLGEATKPESSTVDPKNADPKKLPVDDWVECVKCKKWRLVDPNVEVNKLPSFWVCSMNDWIQPRSLAKCHVPEEETNRPSYLVGVPLIQPPGDGKLAEENAQIAPAPVFNKTEIGLIPTVKEPQSSIGQSLTVGQTTRGKGIEEPKVSGMKQKVPEVKGTAEMTGSRPSEKKELLKVETQFQKRDETYYPRRDLDKQKQRKPEKEKTSSSISDTSSTDTSDISSSDTNRSSGKLKGKRSSDNAPKLKAKQQKLEGAGTSQRTGPLNENAEKSKLTKGHRESGKVEKGGQEKEKILQEENEKGKLVEEKKEREKEREIEERKEKERKPLTGKLRKENPRENVNKEKERNTVEDKGKGMKSQQKEKQSVDEKEKEGKRGLMDDNGGVKYQQAVSGRSRGGSSQSERSFKKVGEQEKKEREFSRDRGGLSQKREAEFRETSREQKQSKDGGGGDKGHREELRDERGSPKRRTEPRAEVRSDFRRDFRNESRERGKEEKGAGGKRGREGDRVGDTNADKRRKEDLEKRQPQENYLEKSAALPAGSLPANQVKSALGGGNSEAQEANLEGASGGSQEVRNVEDIRLQAKELKRRADGLPLGVDKINMYFRAALLYMECTNDSSLLEHVNREYMKLRHFGGAYIALQLAGVSNSRLARQTVPLNFTDRAKAARAVLKAVETEAEATSALLLGGRIRSTVKNLFLDASLFYSGFQYFSKAAECMDQAITEHKLTEDEANCLRAVGAGGGMEPLSQILSRARKALRIVGLPGAAQV